MVAVEFRLGRARGGRLPAVHRLLGQRREGRRAGPSRQRRRPAQRGHTDLPRSPSPTGVVSTRGRARPEHTYDATGGAICRARSPSPCSSTGRPRHQSEIVTGSLQDRHRATVVGTRTFGKGVFQEVERLSNGGALDITVGEYFLPSGPQPRRGRRRAGAPASPRTSRRPTTPRPSATRRSRPG